MFAASLRAILAAPRNRKSGPSVLDAQRIVPTFLFLPVFGLPTRLPYRPAPWPVPRRTLVGPVLPVLVNQSRGAASDTSAMPSVSGKACAVAVATAGGARAKQDPAGARGRIRRERRRRQISPGRTVR